MRPSDFTGYTLDELTDMAAEIRRTQKVPVEERERTGSIHLYPPAVQARLTAIAWAITNKLRGGAGGMSTPREARMSDRARPWTRLRRLLFGWRPDEVEAQYQTRTQSWQCWCGMPRCAWSDKCPTHSTAAEARAWADHPRFSEWCERIGEDPVEHAARFRAMTD